MHRRRWLKLGLGAAALLAFGGGALALVEPGLQGGRLTPAGRTVFGAVGAAVLDGVLPAAGGARDRALLAFLDRVDAVTAALPQHAQAELSQLLELLATGAGRRALAGLGPDWSRASVPEIQAALDAMRLSTVTLRQQAYLALHDISGAAYFADRSAWTVLAYPGPVEV
jgi:hypothetical protein